MMTDSQTASPLKENKVMHVYVKSSHVQGNVNSKSY